ncbi:hypothetical protein H2241_22530 [Pantoea ananatis]|uniref:hypothetical protein n=1 Tax=Pantoea ananas TaxID=553 RepID=UPI00158AA3A4|nr:hypothetical protein [Pantoea ananatis]MBA4823712.1 hypothetical protein [Pantoea ananatis]QKV86119.1 hypothetical protein FOB88_02860 [Pantoea ananatis]
MKLSKNYLSDIIQYYGFIECGQALSFLKYVCDECPDEIDLTWVYGKINHCLRVNDNGSEYFNGLKRVMKDIEGAFRHEPPACKESGSKGR